MKASCETTSIGRRFPPDERIGTRAHQISPRRTASVFLVEGLLGNQVGFAGGIVQVAVARHLLAERALMEPVAGLAEPGENSLSQAPGSTTPAAAACGGKAYFITNGEPVVLWDWLNEVLRGVGAPSITKHVPLPVAYVAGGLLEAVWRLGKKSGEPPMTRFVAKEMATDHWFDIAAARCKGGHIADGLDDSGEHGGILNGRTRAQA